MPRYRITSYRYPSEEGILALTLLLVAGVIIFTATATFCTAGIFILLMLVVVYFMNKSHHEGLIRQAKPITYQAMPEVYQMVKDCADRLQPGPIQSFVAGSNQLNAYTFGMSDPKIVVLYSSLFKIMDADEIRFIIGHELGHVSLGHTWLNTLIGGMAGIPAPMGAAVILSAAFMWWNRACEYSADRAGLLACGSLAKATSALVKLSTGSRISTQAEMDRAMAVVDKEDDDITNVVAEMLATHPMIIKRINELKKYAASPEYSRLQAEIARS